MTPTEVGITRMVWPLNSGNVAINIQYDVFELYDERRKGHNEYAGQTAQKV